MRNNGYKLPSLIKGKLIKRYKRFLADIELESGEQITATKSCVWSETFWKIVFRSAPGNWLKRLRQ